MLPQLADVQGVCGGQGQGPSARLAACTPRPHAPRAAFSGPGATPHGGLLAAPRSRPLPVGGRRGSAAAASGGATAVATTPPPSSASTAAAATPEPPISLGYDRDLSAKYEWGRELGKGGNGTVRIVTDRSTGEEFACKEIRKTLPADASDAKRRGHIDSIRREVEVMRRLAGSLAVVRLVDVFEDDDAVYIVQELCRGGELHHRINDRHYSERTVASFMRAVLRTLAQCHSHHILHRDIKPGNFMLLDDSDRAPLKAIDFGLAVPFDPEGLPRTDLGLEGTPWYMAPEVLSSSVTPASDVWSAGVMAHQLLTGRLPFDDHRNPFAPSISAVWRSVLCDKVNYNMPWWAGMSDDAKDFVNSLLQRDPEKRPTAKEALKHPWLRGNSSERSAGKSLGASVVQRIQRFAAASVFKRGVLQLIAEELLARPGAMAALAASASQQDLPAAAAPTEDGTATAAEAGGSSNGGSAVFPALRELYKKLQFDPSVSTIDGAQAAEALGKMGFRLEPSEAAQLVDTMDTSRSGRVRRSALAASQIDWRALQQSDVAAWIDIARRAFSSLDKDRDGVISTDEIVSSLRAKLPDDELRATLEQVMVEAGGGAGDAGLDFESFLNMLRVGSVDSLDQYDARFEFASPGSLDRLQSLLDASHHGSDGSSHRGRRPGAAAPSSGGGAAASPAGGGAEPAAGADYRDKSWNKPAPNFRFDFGGWDEPGGGRHIPGKSDQAAPAADGAADATAAAPPLQPAPRAWPGLTTGAPTGLVPPFGAPAPPAANGTVRGGAHFDRRMHGASLYRNMLVGGSHHHHHHAPAAVALETVKE